MANEGESSSGERGSERNASEALALNATNLTCTPLMTDCFCHAAYQFYEGEEKLLIGLIGLPIIVFGLCANLTSVKIFTNKMMRMSSINWHLTVLSCSDMAVLISAFFVLTLPRVGEFFREFSAVRVSYWTTPYMYAMMLMAQTVSVYMTILMSLHRFIGVCLPFSAGRLLTRVRVKFAIAFVLSFAVLFNITRFFEVVVAKKSCFRDNILELIPVIAPTALRLDPLYMNLFFGWFYTIFMFGLPFMTLIVVNTMVIMAVHRSRRLHAGLSTGDDATKKQELAKEISTSIMLIGIVVVFISCNTLAFVVNIMENLKMNTTPTYFRLVAYSNLLVIINASVNIVIYCLFSDKYRLLLKYYLCCYWSRQGEMLTAATAFTYNA